MLRKLTWLIGISLDLIILVVLAQQSLLLVLWEPRISAILSCTLTSTATVGVAAAAGFGERVSDLVSSVPVLACHVGIESIESNNSNSLPTRFKSFKLSVDIAL